MCGLGMAKRTGTGTSKNLSLSFNRFHFGTEDAESEYNDLTTELLRTDQQGFLKELDENLLSRQPSESSIPVKRWRRCVECCHACCLYRAAFGFTCTMSLFVLGLVLLMVAEVAFEGNDLLNEQMSTASGFFIAMGFFGTFSGITNLLANVALFYGIPYLPGIGIISRRYRQIQQIIKDVILNMLFDSEFLKRYISQQLQKTSTSVHIKDSIESALSSVEASQCVADHLDRVYREPEGYDLEQLGLTRQQVHSVIKPFILGLCAESAPLVIQELSDGTESWESSTVRGLSTCAWFPLSLQSINSAKLRAEMDRFLAWRMERIGKWKLTSRMFKLMFKHLDWTVLWGCLFGLLAGAIAEALRISVVL